VTVHQVDIVLSWFDRAPVRVFANQTRKTGAGSVLAATLMFDDGSQGTIRDDFASELRRSWPVTIVGEEGSLDGTDDIEIPEAGQPRMARSTLRLGLHARPGVAIDLPLLYRYAPESFGATMGDLLLAVRDGTEPWASGRNVLRTMRTLFAIERSVATGEPVALAEIGSEATEPA
jgi:predicted dehydrogenase